MSNKKVGIEDIEAGTRAAKRHLQHKKNKQFRKERIAEHNDGLIHPEFDHALERKSRLNSGQRMTKNILKYRRKKSVIGPGRFHPQALSHGKRFGKHRLTKSTR